MCRRRRCGGCRKAFSLQKKLNVSRIWCVFVHFHTPWNKIKVYKQRFVHECKYWGYVRIFPNKLGKAEEGKGWEVPPAGSGAEPQQKSNLVMHLALKSDIWWQRFQWFSCIGINWPNFSRCQISGAGRIMPRIITDSRSSPWSVKRDDHLVSNWRRRTDQCFC